MSERPLRAKTLDVFLVACESSADVLGAGLMQSLAVLRPDAVRFRGIGGPLMTRAGSPGAFAAAELGMIGVGGVLRKLPTILRLIRATADAIVAAPPDVLVLIDAPDFTHRVAARVRRRLPRLPIVKYVSPSVWAWRPGRARAMRRAVDLLLAVLPFEPEVHRQLGGPPCLYVGHPLLGRLKDLRPSPDEDALRARDPPMILVLPGSRISEIRRLCPVFGETLGAIVAKAKPVDVVLPTVPHLTPEVARLTSDWPVPPRIVTGEVEKYAAFRRARAALAASGTVTLELALAGIPTIAAYRIPALEGLILRAIVRVHPVIGVRSVILANLVLGELVVPEFLQRRCTAANLAPALTELLADRPARRRQVDAFKRLDDILGTGDAAPSERAARAILDLVAAR